MRTIQRDSNNFALLRKCSKKYRIFLLKFPGETYLFAETIGETNFLIFTNFSLNKYSMTYFTYEQNVLEHFIILQNNSVKNFKYIL
jgi:hypothetical protein